MKISYRREIRHNYLIIDPEEIEWSGYECQMLAENQIDGILRFQLRQMDEGVRFYYEITSRQPLTRLLENRKVRAAELRRLVMGIASVLERMEEYLLREERVLLEPDYLYVEPETFRISLCLIPGLQRDFAEDFGRLLEYLLGSVDHHDKESVILVYGMYQETRKENYGMEDIMRLLYQEKGEHDTKYEMREPLCAKPLIDQPQSMWLPDGGMLKEQEGREERPLLYNPYHKNKYDGNRMEESENSEKSEKKSSWWQAVKTWFQEKFQRQDQLQQQEKFQKQNGLRKQEESMEKASWEVMFSDESERKQEQFPDEAVKKQLPLQFQHASEMVQPDRETSLQQTGTALLADFSEKKNGHILRALDAGEEDIPISYYPFIIGKQENLVDYKLDRDTVSRLHIRIDRFEEQYRVQDLNSTNGTMVRGQLLDNNENVEIQPGDEISIAQYRYRFE